MRPGRAPVIPATSSGALVSVITPAHNAARFIGETIDSVRNQTYRNWEMLIVDDQSSDATMAIARAGAAADPRIRCASTPRNLGAGPTRNHAIEMARGQYIAFLDSDDLWDPAKLETQVKFMKERRTAFSFTGYRVITEAGDPIGSLRDIPVRLSYRELLKRNPIGCLTVMLDRSQIGDIAFPPFRTNQDFALWLEILRRGVDAEGLAEELASYRIVEGSNTRNKLKSARNVWRAYRAQPLHSLDLVWLYAHYALNGLRKHLRTGACLGTIRQRLGLDLGQVASATSASVSESAHLSGALSLIAGNRPTVANILTDHQAGGAWSCQGRRRGCSASR